jgi:hypothetical protein
VIRKDRAKALREKAAAAAAAPAQGLPAAPQPASFTLVSPEPEAPNGSGDLPAARKIIVRVKGSLPPELWNRFGSKIVPKLRSAENLQARVELTVEVAPEGVTALESELRQLLNDLDLNDKIVIEKQSE